MYAEDATLLYIIQRISLIRNAAGQALMMKYQVPLSIYPMQMEDV
jgi:hypothetical protein